MGEQVMERVRAAVPRVDGYMLRRLAYLGSRYGPEPLVRYSPKLWGVLFGLTLGDRRRIVRHNLRRVLGRRRWWVEEVDALRTFVHYAHCLAESLGAERASGRATSPRLIGESHLTDEIARGQGVVLVTAHTGTWDVAARALAQQLNAEVLIVMQREDDARARELHDAVRKRPGVRIVHVDHPLDGVTLLRHLRTGGIVAIQIDRVPPSTRAVEVELFGAPFRFPEGPFLLAATAQVALVPVFTRRCGFFEYEIAFGLGRRLPRRPEAVEVSAVADCVAAELAHFVRAHPNDWFHFDDG